MTEPNFVETIDWGSIAALLVTSLAIMGSPGPATISLTAAGSAYGVRRSAGYLAGIIGGTWIVLVAVATGITATILAVPAMRSLLLAISSAYIVWLAYRIATAHALMLKTATSAAPSLVGGTVLGVTNPKGWVAIAAVFASTHLADRATVDAAAKGAVLAGMVVLITTSWLFVGASLSPILRDPTRSRIVNTVLAALLLGATAVAVLR
jgi:threonine/homoserine/homoserine lactone efflux protein